MKVYIDCGSYEGGTIRKFIKSSYYTDDFKIYAFDPNPRLTQSNYNDNVTFIQKAVWTSDDIINFYINTKNIKKQCGSSIIKEKITGSLDKENPIKVNTIDFSSWLKNNFTINDYIIVQMNIEGAEYDVLNKCINDGAINLINILFVQFHEKKIKLGVEKHNKLLIRLSNIKTLSVFIDSKDPLEQEFYGLHKCRTNV
jgi:FkbM family methyltransferase